MLSIVMVVSTAAAASVAPARVQDIGGYWAEKTMTECKEKGLSQAGLPYSVTAPPPLRPALHSELAEKAAKLQFSACDIFSVIEILQNGINLNRPEGWKANIGENDALLQELYRKAADRA